MTWKKVGEGMNMIQIHCMKYYLKSTFLHNTLFLQIKSENFLCKSFFSFYYYFIVFKLWLLLRHVNFHTCILLYFVLTCFPSFL